MKQTRKKHSAAFKAKVAPCGERLRDWRFGGGNNGAQWSSV
jgi:hypothetical protein